MNKGKSKHAYELVFSRECSVPTMEVWYHAENEVLFRYLRMRSPQNGYMFFEYENGVAKNYVDMDTVNEFTSRALGATLENPRYFKRIENVFWSNFRKYELFLKNKKSIKSGRDLQSFYVSVGKVWGAMVLPYWLAYFADPKVPKNIIKNSEKIRLAIENVIPDFDRLFEKALHGIYKGHYSSALQYATISEILKEDLPERDVLAKRKKYSIFFKNKIYTDISLKKFSQLEGKKIFSFKADKKQDTISGQAAFNGIVRGKARLLITQDNYVKLKKSEILVAPNTSPDYLSSIVKAGAIVTDEGGMLSHAAIVSRELKKPCIIGTKIATKVIKDGDLVEVDANKGIVRILERK